MKKNGLKPLCFFHKSKMYFHRGRACFTLNCDSIRHKYGHIIKSIFRRQMPKSGANLHRGVAM